MNKQLKSDMRGFTRFSFYTAACFVSFSLQEGSITPLSAMLSLYGGMMIYLCIAIVNGIWRRYGLDERRQRHEH